MSSSVNLWVFVAIYGLLVLGFAWLESRLLVKWELGGKVGAMIYAATSHLVTSIVAPVGVMAALAAGMISVLGAAGNTDGVTTDMAFRSVAVPITWTSILVLVAVRAIPLFFMNLRRVPSRALLYGVFSCPVLCIGYLVLGVPLLVWIVGGGY